MLQYSIWQCSHKPCSPTAHNNHGVVSLRMHDVRYEGENWTLGRHFYSLWPSIFATNCTTTTTTVCRRRRIIQEAWLLHTHTPETRSAGWCVRVVTVHTHAVATGIAAAAAGRRLRRNCWYDTCSWRAPAGSVKSRGARGINATIWRRNIFGRGSTELGFNDRGRRIHLHNWSNVRKLWSIGRPLYTSTAENCL